MTRHLQLVAPDTVPQPMQGDDGPAVDTPVAAGPPLLNDPFVLATDRALVVLGDVFSVRVD